MWLVAFLGLVYHNSKDSTVHAIAQRGTVRHYEHVMTKSSSWVIEFPDPHGILVFTSDGDFEIFAGVHSSSTSAIEWYEVDSSVMGVISLGNLFGTVEIVSKSDAMARFTALYLGDPLEDQWIYSEIRAYSTGEDEPGDMPKNTRIAYVIAGQNITVRTAMTSFGNWAILRTYGWDPVRLVNNWNLTLSPGSVWMLDLTPQQNLPAEFYPITFSFEGDEASLNYPRVTFDMARDKFGVFTEKSFVEFSSAEVLSVRDKPVPGALWPGITRLVLFILVIVGIFAVRQIRMIVVGHKISEISKRLMREGPPPLPPGDIEQSEEDGRLN